MLKTAFSVLGRVTAALFTVTAGFVSAVKVVDAFAADLRAPQAGYYLYRAGDVPVHYTELPPWAYGADGTRTWKTYALPANALPANALPANALPANALPANALPANAIPANIVQDRLAADSLVSPQNLLWSGAIPANNNPQVQDQVRPVLAFKWMTAPSGSEVATAGGSDTPSTGSQSSQSSGSQGSSTSGAGSEVVTVDPCREQIPDPRITAGSADDPGQLINITTSDYFWYSSYILDVGGGKTFNCDLFSTTRLICTGKHFPSGTSSVQVNLRPLGETCSILSGTVAISPSSGSSGSGDSGSSSSCAAGEYYCAVWDSCLNIGLTCGP